VSAADRFRVTVYASSSDRIDPVHAVVAEELGRRIAERGWDLVWGGGRFGLMGAVSRGARAAGGRTIGVILQQFVDKNVHCEAAHEMATVGDMRSRKRGLDEAGDAYVALPGGLGTLEELLEILSFKQLGFHRKPVVVLDAFGYWQPLLAMLERGFTEGFIQPHFRGLWTVAATAAEAIDQIANAEPWRVQPRDPRGGGSA
jgi:cytokinin riboside 5'-monophosphate phosphoribohydrolase